MTGVSRARERYRKFRDQARQLIEDEAFHTFQRRVDVVAIDNDVLRQAQRDWYGACDRKVGWDWDRDIIAPLHSFGARTFSAAFVVQGQLCAMMAARVSPAKRWLSLTYVEGCPGLHPLKGEVIPLALVSLQIFRAVICDQEDPKHVGLRVLRPSSEALHCYLKAGYTDLRGTKRDLSIVVESPMERS